MGLPELRNFLPPSSPTVSKTPLSDQIREAENGLPDAGRPRRSGKYSRSALLSTEEKPPMCSQASRDAAKSFLDRNYSITSLDRLDNAVPRETWGYLLERGPCRDAEHIRCTLKHATHLKRKCYKSVPFLVAALCTKTKMAWLLTKKRPFKRVKLKRGS